MKRGNGCRDKYIWDLEARLWEYPDKQARGRKEENRVGQRGGEGLRGYGPGKKE